MRPTDPAHRTLLSMPSAQEIRMTRLLDAPRDLVFAAWTDPEHVPHWLLGAGAQTMPVCEIDLRVGGSWRFVWRREDGSEIDMNGSYLEISPPDRLVNTEKWGPEWPETVNTLVLTEEAGKTRMTLTVRYVSQAARDAAAATGMKGGAEYGYELLNQYLQTIR